MRKKGIKLVIRPLDRIADGTAEQTERIHNLPITMANVHGVLETYVRALGDIMLVDVVASPTLATGVKEMRLQIRVAQCTWKDVDTVLSFTG